MSLTIRYVSEFPSCYVPSADKYQLLCTNALAYMYHCRAAMYRLLCNTASAFMYQTGLLISNGILIVYLYFINDNSSC